MCLLKNPPKLPRRHTATPPHRHTDTPPHRQSSNTPSLKQVLPSNHLLPLQCSGNKYLMSLKITYYSFLENSTGESAKAARRLLGTDPRDLNSVVPSSTKLPRGRNTPRFFWVVRVVWNLDYKSLLWPPTAATFFLPSAWVPWVNFNFLRSIVSIVW